MVIPTFERPNDLRICLKSLCAPNQPNAPFYEIIVSDDSKSDDSKILVENEFPEVKWGEGKKLAQQETEILE